MIARDTVYRRLDRQKEELRGYEEKEYGSARKSSDVIYFTGTRQSPGSLLFPEKSRCSSVYRNADTLVVFVGINTGMGGWGFGVICRKQTFTTQTYHHTDLVFPNRKEPIHAIIYQQLTLDKPSYQPGDSLYGKIAFKLLQIAGNDTSQHFGKGYFRTRVKALDDY